MYSVVKMKCFTFLVLSILNVSTSYSTTFIRLIIRSIRTILLQLPSLNFAYQIVVDIYMLATNYLLRDCFPSINCCFLLVILRSLWFIINWWLPNIQLGVLKSTQLITNSIMGNSSWVFHIYTTKDYYISCLGLHDVEDHEPVAEKFRYT